MEILLNVNGTPQSVSVAPQRTLLEVLRESFGYTGTKQSCGTGECGACTVIVDGRAVLACLTLAVEVQGRKVVTIEGLGTGDRLDPLQQSFVDCGAVQCGYCTPGMVLSAKALLDETPHPSREEVLRSIGGNLCRCTGYAKIVEAIEDAAARRAAQPNG
ncbi:MAG: (2Fe-2S)-binding protein [Deltaproteobacteria bacterium]|nr:(2Fe-2S)-binding protein [Deltaproteobacteria bacterium]